MTKKEYMEWFAEELSENLIFRAGYVSMQKDLKNDLYFDELVVQRSIREGIKILNHAHKTHKWKEIKHYTEEEIAPQMTDREKDDILMLKYDRQSKGKSKDEKFKLFKEIFLELEE